MILDTFSEESSSIVINSPAESSVIVSKVVLPFRVRFPFLYDKIPSVLILSIVREPDDEILGLNETGYFISAFDENAIIEIVLYSSIFVSFSSVTIPSTKM